jgi:hypothetical protein
MASKSKSTLYLIGGLGLAAAVYMWTHKAAAGIITTAGALAPVSGADYAAAQSAIVSAQTSDNAPALAATELDTITQAYLRKNKAELTGYVTYFQGKAQTATAALFADALSHALSGT